MNTTTLEEVRDYVIGRIITYGGVGKYADAIGVPREHILSLAGELDGPPTIPHKKVLEDIGLSKHRIYAKNTPKEA